ncbi:hypothetical protein RhiXN_01646 [Rhizoctonia solani]|uniref:Uncharacterized protein n=1 Tax=Rhizoctonia solani TaxID=456999 RepID=A0A8H8PB82_9AGAM|nr:uncharacterized protein RhiXN_01646 [Rhizoctonia solani]QRW27051.1 hypothetical protein RhiXN_01646 [Rhizoctonia solani]
MSATPMQVPLIPFLTLQSLLFSGVPHAWPLEMFCAQVLEIPELSEAPVRVLTTLFHCGSESNVVQMLGVGVLLNKPKPAMDTVKASTNVETLREQCEPRDSFLYNHNESRPKYSSSRTSLKCADTTPGIRANTRFSEPIVVGFATFLLECLRESRPCYGGTWLPSGTDRPTADVRAAQLAKSHYLKDKHSACCGRQYLVYPNLGSLAKTTMGWTSIAIANSSQTISNQSPQCTEQDVLYRTRSLPESVWQRSGTGIGLVTSLRENSPGATVSKNSALSNSTPSRSEPGTQNPIDRNATQIPQPLSASNNIANPPEHQHTTTPPAKNVVSQSSGDVSVTSHCSGCQCAGHAHSQIMSSTPQNGPEPHSSIPDSKAGNALDLSSRVSSMNIGSDTSALRAGYGQSTTDECTSATRGRVVPTHRPSLDAQVVALKGAYLLIHYHHPVYQAQRCQVQFGIRFILCTRCHQNAYTLAFINVLFNMPPVQIQHNCSSRHAQCSPRADLRNNSSSSPAPRMARIPDGANRFDTRSTLPSTSMLYFRTLIGEWSYVLHCTSAQSIIDMVDARECHHIHNCSPTVVSAPSRPVSRNHPSYIRAPSHSSREVPPTPTHHVAQGSYQATRAALILRFRETQRTEVAPVLQAPHTHPHALPLPLECNANILGDHYRSAPPTGSLYNIPEGPSQVGLNDNWDASSESWVPINEPMDINISAQYGVQPALSNPVQPSPLPNPLLTQTLATRLLNVLGHFPRVVYAKRSTREFAPVVGTTHKTTVDSRKHNQTEGIFTGTGITWCTNARPS